MGTLETEIAQHIAALIHGHTRLGDNGVFEFHATENGPLIHVTTTDISRDRPVKKDAWVLTVEWDGER